MLPLSAFSCVDYAYTVYFALMLMNDTVCLTRVSANSVLGELPASN